MATRELRIVFSREGDRWVAHCLELDLLGDGESQESALHSLATAVQIQIEQSWKYNNPANLWPTTS